MESEDAIGSQALLPDAVAVLPFTTPDGDPEMAPVGKGLAEMLITDLSQIKRLTLVERIRVQSLFDEMELGQTGLVEESEAARFGKMLRAGRVVRGAVSGDMNSRVRMEASALNALRGEAGNPVAVSDAFKNLFRAEKDMAFKMLARLGIEPTPQERQRILKVPTQNLQAFIAYCNGLDLEDKGEFQKAAAQYRKAVELDPQYRTAQQKLRANQILARVGEAGFRKSGFRPSPDGAPQFDREALIENRLQTVQSNIGSNFMLGKDVRKPVQEAAEATDYAPPDGGDLPGPPALPTPLP
jgi:TolB-like protein